MKNIIPILLLAFTMLLSLGLHISIFDKEIGGIHDWRQCQTAWNIRNFLRHDNNILNPRVASFNGGKDNLYRYEFPIMQWSVAQAQRVFGEKVWVIRACMFVIGLFTLLGMYFLLRGVGLSALMSSVGVWAFCFSPVFYYYTLNPLPDVFALCMAVWYLVFFLRSTQTQQTSHMFWAGLFLSLSVAAKLPYILFGGATFFYLMQRIIKNGLTDKSIFREIGVYLLLILPTAAWYAWVIPTWSNGVILGVFDNHISFAWACDILYYHCYTMFPQILMNMACLPFLFLGIWFVLNKKTVQHKGFYPLLFVLALIIAYFFYELNMIEKVHDYYMMPFLPFLFILIAIGIAKVGSNTENKPLIALSLFCLLLMPLLCLFQNKNAWTPQRLNSVYDNLAAFQNIGTRDEHVIMLNDLSNYVLPYILDKRGHIFKDNYLPRGWVWDMAVNYNIKYMFSDSRPVEATIQDYIQDTVYTAGEFKVFKFKDVEVLKGMGQ